MPSMKQLALLFNALPSGSLNLLHSFSCIIQSGHFIQLYTVISHVSNTVEPPCAITSRKRPSPISDHLTVRIPKFFQSITYSKNLS